MRVLNPFSRGKAIFLRTLSCNLGLQPLHFAPNAGPELASLLTSLPCVPLFAAAALAVRALCAHFEHSLFPEAAARSCLPMHTTCACRFALGASAPCLRISAVFRRGAAAYADASERRKTRKCSFLLYLLLLFCRAQRESCAESTLATRRPSHRNFGQFGQPPTSSVK